MGGSRMGEADISKRYSEVASERPKISNQEMFEAMKRRYPNEPWIRDAISIAFNLKKAVAEEIVRGWLHDNLVETQEKEGATLYKFKQAPLQVEGKKDGENSEVDKKRLAILSYLYTIVNLPKPFNVTLPELSNQMKTPGQDIINAAKGLPGLSIIPEGNTIRLRATNKVVLTEELKKILPSKKRKGQEFLSKEGQKKNQDKVIAFLTGRRGEKFSINDLCKALHIRLTSAILAPLIKTETIKAIRVKGQGRRDQFVYFIE